MPNVWPFAWRDQIIESNEWLTDVIRTKTAEQRFAMRQTPRQSFILAHTLLEDEYQAARALIRQNDSFLLPDRTLGVYVGAINPGSDAFVNYGEHYAGMTDGDQAIIFESIDKYESVTIESADSADGWYLDNVTNEYDAATIYPARQARTLEGLRASRRAGGFIDCEITFDLIDSRDISKNNYIKYQGRPLVTDCPVIASDTFSEPLVWPIEPVDYDINYPTYLTQRDTFDANYMIRWHVFNRADLYQLRRFLHYCRGRWRSFWASSWTNDLTLAQQIGATDTSVVVYAPGGVTDLGYTSFDIEIDKQYRRRVTSYTTGTAANGKPILTLNIDAQTGTLVGPGARVSFLRHVRFDADRIEMLHAANGGVVVAAPLREVNQ